MGAYPLNKLVFVEEQIICEICFKKRTLLQKEKELHSKFAPPKSSSSRSIFPAVFIPLFGFFWIHWVIERTPSKNNTFTLPKKHPKALFFNLIWTLFLFYIGGEFYLFQNETTPQKRIQAHIQEVIKAQENFKKDQKRYGMFEQLIQKNYLPWKLEITTRKVLVEKEDYQFQIYVASNELWQMKVLPKSPNSLALRYYVDQKNSIRYSHIQEADENSPLLPLQISFLNHLLQRSWVARFYHYLIS